jgi:hypothetical protein
MKSVLSGTIKRESVIDHGPKPKPGAAPAKDQKTPPHKLFVRLVSAANGKPLAVDYEVESAAGKAIGKGKTDYTGTLTQDPVDPGEYKVKVSGSNLVGTARSIAKDAATKTPVDVKVGYRIEVLMKAIGGSPLRNERVSIIDPTTKKPVGEPVETDAEGLLSALVPEEKEYDLQIVDDDGPAGDVEAFAPFDTDGGLHDPDDDPHVLRVRLVDLDGKPLAKEQVKVTAASGETLTFTTQDDGDVEDTVPPGPCTIEARGKTLHAHTLPLAVAEQLTHPFKIVVK